MKNEIKYLTSRLFEPATKAGLWVAEHKKRLQMIVAGGAIVGGNILAGSVIYQQNEQIERLKKAELILADEVDKLDARMSFSEYTQGFNFYVGCRNARAIWLGNDPDREAEDEDFCRIAVTQMGVERPK